MIGFGNFTKKAEPYEITSLIDKRLVKIDPQEAAFFDTVMNVKSTNIYAINAFVEAIAEVKAARLEAFYRAIYDPSEEDHMITFQKGKRPAVGHSYNWWVETASKMSAVDGRHWHLATEYQYYAFLVWLINQLVKGEKSSVEVAMKMVVLDSKELGHYYNSENSKEGKDFEATGSRCVCGVYDLANTSKFLSCSNKEAGVFWLSGGGCSHLSDTYPLANLGPDIDVVYDCNGSVGLLVL